MAIQQLTQPIINPIAAFDATQNHVVTFLAIGGAQVVGNRIVISDNQTGKTVYDNRVITMQLAHTIPANTLTNGGYYNVVIYTIDSANNFSQASVPVPFYCYSQPTLTINNIPASSTIENGTYTFQGSYAQQENEILNSYQFILYDSNKTVLSQSDVIYYSSNNSLSYTFVGMSNDTSYYIELKGQTVNNTEITTGLLYFTVRYSQPVSFAIVDLVNDCENGFIQISSNIVAIDGKSNPEPPIYIDNKEVDLREPDSWVRWDEGFNIKDDFTMRVWGRDFNDFEPIITLSNKNNTDSEPNKIEMKWMIANVMKILPDYTLVSGKNISIVDGYKTDINDLAIYGNSEQIKKDSIGFGTANSMTIDTTEDMFLDIDVYGNQYQATREGYNLYDVNTLIVNQENVTVKKNETGYIIKSGDTVTPSKIGRAVIETTSLFDISKNYTFSCDITLNKAGKSEAGWVGLENTIQKDITANQKEHVVIRINNQVGTYLTLGLYTSNCVMTVENIQLVEGTDDKEYEQYGVSPSPDYPSEIETVGSNVNYLDESTVESKFLNSETGKTSDNASWRCTDFIEILSKQYNFSWESDSEYFQATVCYYDKNKTFIYGNEYGLFKIYSKTFEIPDGANYMKVAYSIIVNGKPVTRDKIKLEIGNKRTLYSPYMCGSVEIDVVNKNFYKASEKWFNNIGGVGLTVSERSNKECTLTTTQRAYTWFGSNQPGGSQEYRTKVKENTKYTFSIKAELLKGTAGIGLFIFFDRNLTSEYFEEKHKDYSSNITFVTPAGTNYIHFRIDIYNANTAYRISEIKIEAEDGTDKYEKHQSQTAIMPIQQEMLSGDYIAGVKHHEWKKIIIDTSKLIEEVTNEEGKKRYKYWSDKNIKKSDITNNVAYSNMFKLISDGQTYWNIKGFTIVNNTIYIYDEGELLAEFISKIADKQLVFYAQLATPVDLELTDEQKTVKNTLINAYEPITNVYASDDLSLVKVYTTPIPSPKLPSKIYSSGDKKNQLKDLGIINIDYTQGYFKTTDTDFILKPDFVYNLSFDYIVNNTTTDLYFTVSYKSNGEIFDITNASQYTNKTTGRNNISFIVPADIPANSTLSIKFARTIIQADVSVSVRNVALVKGRFATDYQSPDIYNIYPTATQKNIFNYNDIYYIKNQNATLTFIQNGFSSEVVTTGEKSFFEFGFPNILQPGNKYAISYNSYGAIKSAKVYTMDKETGKTLKQIVTENGVFTAPSNLYDIKAEFILDDSVSDNQVQVWNIQLESGEQVTEAETYTANSIDLTLEQPLRGIGNYRDLACLESPNILNPETQTAIVKGSTTYSLSQSGTTAYKFDYINEDNNIISSENMASGQFTTPDNCIRIKFDTTSDIITTNKLQVNLGNTAMVYYPYVNEPSIIRYISERKLDGSVNSRFLSKHPTIHTSERGFYQFNLPNAITKGYGTTNYGICNYLTYTPGIAAQAIDKTALWWEGGNTHMNYASIPFTTLGEANQWLTDLNNKGNPLTIEYVLNNPIVEPLSSDNILALQNLKTYEGISNVFTNNNMPANLNLSYISGQSKQETKNAYVTLKCWNGNVMPYFIHSNYIDIPKETDKIFIWLRRKNNIFDLKIENLGDYGEDKPGNKGNPQVAITVDDTTTTTITITSNTIDTATLSNVKFSKDNGVTWDAEIPLDGLSSTDTYTFIGLQPATTYQIRVEATNVNGITGGITQQVITRAS